MKFIICIFLISILQYSAANNVPRVKRGDLLSTFSQIVQQITGPLTGKNSPSTQNDPSFNTGPGSGTQSQNSAPAKSGPSIPQQVGACSQPLVCDYLGCLMDNFQNGQLSNLKAASKVMADPRLRTSLLKDPALMKEACKTKDLDDDMCNNFRSLLQFADKRDPPSAHVHDEDRDKRSPSDYDNGGPSPKSGNSNSNSGNSKSSSGTSNSNSGSASSKSSSSSSKSSGNSNNGKGGSSNNGKGGGSDYDNHPAGPPTGGSSSGSSGSSSSSGSSGGSGGNKGSGSGSGNPPAKQRKCDGNQAFGNGNGGNDQNSNGNSNNNDNNNNGGSQVKRTGKQRRTPGRR